MAVARKRARSLLGPSDATVAANRGCSQTRNSAVIREHDNRSTRATSATAVNLRFERVLAIRSNRPCAGDRARMDDHDSAASMEKKKQEGYF